MPQSRVALFFYNTVATFIYRKIWSIFERARTFGWILSDENPRKVPPKIFKPPLRKFDRSYF